MEQGGIIRACRQRVERRIRQALSIGPFLLLVDQRNHAGKDWRRKTSAARDREIAGRAVSESAVATRRLEWRSRSVPVRLVAAAEEIARKSGRRIECNVRN